MAEDTLQNIWLTGHGLRGLSQFFPSRGRLESHLLISLAKPLDLGGIGCRRYALEEIIIVIIYLQVCN